MKFQFQSFLSVVLVSNGRTAYERYFANEYDRIDATRTGAGAPSRTVTLEIVDALPAELPPDALRFTRRFKKLFTFEFAVEGLGTPDARIHFVDHPVSRVYVTAVGVFVQAHLLEPLMYHALLEEGVLLMHCAAVARDGEAILMPAHGGTGKTTTSMALLSEGYEFLGDDLVLVDPASQRAFPYPRPLHVFTYNIRNLRGTTVPLRVAAAVYVKDVLRFFLEMALRTEFLISTRVHADEIISGFRLATPARLGRVVFLVKEGPSRTVPLDDKAALYEAAEQVVVAADLNESLVALLDGHPLAQGLRAREMEVACRILRAVDDFRILNTRTIDLSEIEHHVAPAADVGATTRGRAS